MIVTLKLIKTILKKKKAKK